MKYVGGSLGEVCAEVAGMYDIKIKNKKMKNFLLKTVDKQGGIAYLVLTQGAIRRLALEAILPHIQREVPMFRKLALRKSVMAFQREWTEAMADEYKSAMLGKRVMTDAQKAAFRAELLRKHGLTEIDI